MRPGISVAMGLLVATTSSGCHRSPMSKIEALRDALDLGSRDRALAAVEVAPCPQPHPEATLTACLDATARAFGATEGFSADPPDQASAATVAYLLVRDHDGVGIPRPDTWLEAVASSSGPGVDALRLAVAAAMAEDAPFIGKHIDTEPEARSMLGAVARTIPGACGTYARIARGADRTSFSAPDSPDHSPCVQHDLERKAGPGPAYGDGLWRAAAGAAALWKDSARALLVGFATTAGPIRKGVRKKLDVIDTATHELNLHVVSTSQSGGYEESEAHRAESVSKTLPGVLLRGTAKSVREAGPPPASP
jgi:hypothetical protein